MNGILNNLSIARNFAQGKESSRYGCGSQSVQVKDDLTFNLGKTDDKWNFQINSNFLGTHWNVIGTSSNPNDPILRIDPWHNSFNRSK